MKKITFYILLLASVWMMVSCNNQPAKPAHSEEEMITAAKAVDAKFIESMNSENLDGVMSCYWNSPELVVYPPGEMETKGFEATKAAFAKFFETTNGAKHEILEANYKVSGDLLYAYGRVTLTLPADSPKPAAALEARFTSIMEYKDNDLVYVVDHASLPLPPPPTEASTEEKK